MRGWFAQPWKGAKELSRAAKVVPLQLLLPGGHRVVAELHAPHCHMARLPARPAAAGAGSEAAGPAAGADAGQEAPLGAEDTPEGALLRLAAELLGAAGGADSEDELLRALHRAVLDAPFDTASEARAAASLRDFLEGPVIEEARPEGPQAPPHEASSTAAPLDEPPEGPVIEEGGAEGAQAGGIVAQLEELPEGPLFEAASPEGPQAPLAPHGAGGSWEIEPWGSLPEDEVYYVDA